MKIGIVGDLSQNDPNLLARALDAALAAADVVVQVGDINPGYDAVKARLGTGRLLLIPGNHDTQGPGNWDQSLPGLPKQWRKDYPGVSLVGLDNTHDSFDEQAFSLVRSQCDDWSAGRIDFVFFHKSLTRLMLLDGSESAHVMGEGGDIPNADAKRMITLLSEGHQVCVCGHYHGCSVMETHYGAVILEGRGGAAGSGNLGYTLIVTTNDGCVAHPVSI